MKTKINKNQPFDVCVERSYVNCLDQGMRAGAEHAGNVWRGLWPLFLLSLPVSFPFYNAAAAFMPDWPASGRVARRSATACLRWGEMWRTLGRFLWFYLCGVILAALFGGLVYYTVSAHVVPVWGFCVVCALLLVAFLPLEWFRLELLFGKAGPGAFGACYRVGLRNFGKLFPFYMIMALCLLVVGALATLPLAMLFMALAAHGLSVKMGDTAYLPTSFWPLLVFAVALSKAVLFHLRIVLMHAEYLLWGSITAREKASGSVEEVPAEAETES